MCAIFWKASYSHPCLLNLDGCFQSIFSLELEGLVSSVYTDPTPLVVNRIHFVKKSVLIRKVEFGTDARKNLSKLLSKFHPA